MKVLQVEFPNDSLLAETNYEYADSFKAACIDKENTIDILDVAKAFFSSTPNWIEKLFRLRNAIVSVFGLKTGDKAASRKEVLANFKGEIGEKIGVFKVFDRATDEIILGEDDIHLNFRVSFLLAPKEQYRKDVIISTTVHFNNWFGRLYFFPVKPFHKLIVPAMLESVIKALSDQNC